MTLKAKIELQKRRKVTHPILELPESIQIVGTGPSVEAATEDASRTAVDFVADNTDLSRDQAYMLLGIVGELRVGTSPRPIMAARLIIDRGILDSLGWQGMG